MADAVLDEELAKGLSGAKKTPRNFALIVKGPNPVKLMVRKKKFRDAELMKVKTESKGDDIIVGVLEASGSDFAFRVLGKEEPGVTTLKLKDLISEQADMTAKPRWELVKELPNIGDEDEQREAQQQDTTVSADAQPVDERAKQIADRLKGLGPQIQQALTARPDRKDDLLAAVANVKTPLSANQIDQAFMAMVLLIDLLKSLLAPAGQQPDATEEADEEELNDLFEEDEADESDEDTAPSSEAKNPTPLPSEEQLIAMTPPPSAASKSPVLSGRAAWEEARQIVAENLAELQKHVAGIEDPDFQKIARYGFQGITGRLQVGLRVALMEFDTGTGEAREKARKRSLEIIEQFQQFVATDPLLRLCDENVFKIPIDGRKILGDALNKLAASLKA